MILRPTAVVAALWMAVAVVPLDAPPAGPVAAVLVDVHTGRLLYAREEHRRMAPASTTKILTALMAIERFPPHATIVVSHNAAGLRTGSRIGLEPGERWTVEDLVFALILASANDAAVAIAEASAGSVRAFAGQMTEAARRLGAQGSRFANPHGLDDPDHYSTAYDLALLARGALSHPRFAAVARAQRWTLTRPGRPAENLVSGNKLLGRYPGADGVKTGMTARAGHTFVASATRDGWQLVAVVLRGRDIYAEASALLDFGYRTFVPATVAARGAVMGTVSVGRPPRQVTGVVPDDVRAVVRRGAVVERRVTWGSDLRLPIAAGQRVGDVAFLEGRDVVARSPLVAAARVGP